MALNPSITEEHRSHRWRVVRDIVPSVIGAFLHKNRSYPYNTDLGPRAEIVELYRKMNKLKAALWDGKALDGEQPPEIAMDMIGHLILLLDMLEQDWISNPLSHVHLNPDFLASEWLDAYYDSLRKIMEEAEFG